MGIVVSCEHGGARIPARWREVLRGQRSLLASHRGFDPGALVLARQLARRLEAPLVAATVSRLLVDLNRSPHHPRLFSEWTRALPAAERERILERHYRPYRERVEALARAAIARDGKVLHVSVHSFTPVLGGKRREVDIGLLYDPARRRERTLSASLRAQLGALLPEARVRANQPYRGTSDGLVPYLRAHLPRRRYHGIELEVNQGWVRRPTAWRALRKALCDAVQGIVRLA